ncbi:hypothetical protein NP233_g53 [Leucocoprinus birnbaumii]|uniref:[histone H3]-trimethyl-L-lysine(9) demethylase n=1 Tax=Leucocoprinus birnbaumii TaxID=56174 RepID=A0AAD5W4K1_9AGAR|nr:hypothetical protein NP233_g53 [Leucocoprinus birnbaumii]
MSRLQSPSSSRSVSPPPPIVQPDHFFGSEASQAPPSLNSERRTWLSPEDDPLAQRGIPVFKPTMAEFEDFEDYMNKVECWGMRSGIVKVIPPKEWTESLPSIIPQLREIQINRPIEQHMIGRGGLFRQENLEKRKFMSVREWVELCRTDEFRAPGVEEVGKRRRRRNPPAPVARTRRTKKKSEPTESAGPDGVTVKEELTNEARRLDEPGPSVSSAITPPSSVAAANSPEEQPTRTATKCPADEKPKPRGRRNQTKEQREANHARDAAFVDGFDPAKDWLPPETNPSDYTIEFCQELERDYWRNLGLAKPAWYGADSQGSLFTDETTSWNVAHLPSTLSRLLPTSDKGLPGVNTPYLYFGMWRATFAWHVEDMDLFSINYIHFGAPKFWYAVPQGRAQALEQTMRSYFPQDTSACPQFLRHKSFLASPTHLANNSCRPNFLVQHAGEFVITYPRGYHAGLNLGLNCAESVNFALDSWIDIGRKAKVCKCVEDSVVIDVDQLLADRAAEQEQLQDVETVAPPTPTSITTKQRAARPIKPRGVVKNEEFDFLTIPLPPAGLKPSRKRKPESSEGPSKVKKIKIKASPIKNPQSDSPTVSPPIRSSLSDSLPPKFPKISVTLKLPPRPTELESFPCCLCVSQNHEGLLRVHDPPVGRKDANEAAGNPKVWMAHEQCAKIVPETWVDEIDGGSSGMKEKMVFGVDGIVKDRWNLKCSSCTRNRPKAHGAPVQCTKGKCPKAFHVSCARENSAILFEVSKEVEKEVILMDSAIIAAMDVDSIGVVPAEGNDQVLKVIKKLEVQILCTQHNPAVAAEKKANKQERIKRELLALPSMSRIKIRVSAGVFEVSLVRVVEETGSVEVLWDRGLKKEFKWGSVVFGSTDGPVHQKPSEPAPEPLTVPQTMAPGSHLSVPLRSPTRQPIPSTSSSSTTPVVATAATTTPTPVSSSVSVTPVPVLAASPPNATATSAPTTSYSVPYYQQRPGYNYWPYGTGQTPYPQYSYPYGGYYANVPMNGTTQYATYPFSQQYRGGQLQWQQPYQGPRPGTVQTVNGTGIPVATTDGQAAGASAAQTEGASSSATDSAQVQGNAEQGLVKAATTPNVPLSVTATGSTQEVPVQPADSSASSSSSTPGITTPDPQATSAIPVDPAFLGSAPPPVPVSIPLGLATASGAPATAMDDSQQHPQFTLTPEMEMAILRNLQALSTMPEAQLAELLQVNPQLKTVLAVMQQSRPAGS